MSEIFLKIVNMSLSASLIILVVLLLRQIFKKTPKWIAVLLWGIVAIRLICPFTVESALSLIPKAEPISPEIITDTVTVINNDVPIVSTEPNLAVNEAPAPQPVESGFSLQALIPTLSVIWLAGIAVLLIYTAISYLRVYKKVRTAVLLRDNIYQSESVISPFVLGIIKPKIYLPFNINEQSQSLVVAHEQAHTSRKDHLWKPLGFLVLTLHWFNPLVWLGYVLLCRDIELACDEKVIKKLSTDNRADYSQALLSCSVNRRMIAACPLAFGEVDVKTRVKNVLNYKKPAFWIIIVAIIAVIVTSVCLLTNPKTVNFSELDPRLQAFLNAQVEEYNQSEQTKYYFPAVSFDLLKVDEKKDQITVYAWVLYQEYGLANGELKEESGAHCLTAITVKKNENNYELIEYWTASDGSLYESSIKDKFPITLWRKALSSQNNIQKQKAECEKAAREYFKISYSTIGGVSDPESVVIAYSFATLTDRSTLSLSKTDNTCSFSFSLLSSYWPTGTYEDTPDFIIMRTDNDEKYTFRKEKDTLVFVANQSSKLPSFAYSTDEEARVPVPDGAVFKKTSSVSFGGNSGKKDDWGISMKLLPKSANEYTVELTHSSTFSSVKGTLTTSPEYEIKALYNGKVLTFGEYMRDVLNYDYADPEFGWDCVLYTINPDSTFTLDINLNVTYGKLPEGIYIFCKPVSLETEAGERLSKTYTATFAVTGDDFNQPTPNNYVDKASVYQNLQEDKTNLDAVLYYTLKDKYSSEKPDGLLHIQSYLLIGCDVKSGTPTVGNNDHAQEATAYLIVYNVKYKPGDTLEVVSREYVPTVITFSIEQNGEYKLKDYWIPRSGANYKTDIRSKFPAHYIDDALDFEQNKADLQSDNIAQAYAYLNKIK